MVDKTKAKKLEAEIRGTLLKLEDLTFLMKEGKIILAYNKLNGIKEKLAKIYKNIKEENSSENDKNQ